MRIGSNLRTAIFGASFLTYSCSYPIHVDNGVFKLHEKTILIEFLE